MPYEDREREFSRRALLRAGWSLPAALAFGGLAAACGGSGGGHSDLASEIVDIAEAAGRRSGISTPATSPTTTPSSTAPPASSSPASSPPASTAPSTTRPSHPPGGGAHTDVPHVDGAHGDVAAAAVLHEDTHGDAPETTHDDILAFERGEGPRFVTFPHFDVPHSDVPHTDQAHVDAPHADTPHADA
jgi:hypothetical protein